MANKFKVGDHVTWKSEAGQVSGTVKQVHTRDFDYRGHAHHACSNGPQYEIENDKTDHVAVHQGDALNEFLQQV